MMLLGTLWFVSLAANAVLLRLWLRKKSMPVIQAKDFDSERVETIAVAIRASDGGFFLANPETGKKIEFTGCTAWSGRMVPQLGKASIVLCDLPVWPGHKAPSANVAEILLEHVPLMT